MASPRIPVLSVRGRPFERGQQYGSQARRQIHKNVELYFDLWGSLWGAKRPEVLEWCAGLVPLIGEYDAEILEELEGVAKGADLSLEEVVALNARYEMVFAQSLAPRGGAGCTSAAALPQATKDGHTFIGQNWDYKPRFQGLSLILEIEQEGRPNIVTHTEAGIIAHRGLNSAGVAVCLNALVSNRDKFELTTPFLIVARGILNADSLSRALKAVLNAKGAVSFDFLIAQRHGLESVVVMNPDGTMNENGTSELTTLNASPCAVTPFLMFSPMNPIRSSPTHAPGWSFFLEAVIEYDAHTLIISSSSMCMTPLVPPHFAVSSTT